MKPDGYTRCPKCRTTVPYYCDGMDEDLEGRLFAYPRASCTCGHWFEEEEIYEGEI